MKGSLLALPLDTELPHGPPEVQQVGLTQPPRVRDIDTLSSGAFVLTR